MFTFTSAIFFMLLDIMLSAILIGAGIIVLALVSFFVCGMIKAMLPTKKPEKPDDK